MTDTDSAKKRMVEIDGKKLILGQVALVEDLCENGFHMTRVNLTRLISKNEGPPEHGTWSNRTVYNAAHVLQWAKDRMSIKRPRRPGRPKKGPPVITLPPEQSPAEQSPSEPKVIVDCEELSPRAD